MFIVVLESFYLVDVFSCVFEDFFPVCVYRREGKAGEREGGRQGRQGSRRGREGGM